VVREWNCGAGQWKNLEKPLELKERTQTLYLKEGNQVRGGELVSSLYL